MAQNTWDFPVASTEDFIDFRASVNNALENLMTNHSGTSAPGTTDDYMWFVDTTNSVVKMENGAGGWYTMFQLADNGGLLRIDGSNAMTGDLDLDGNQLLDCQNTANTNTPSGATAYQLEVLIGATTYYVPAYSSASAWSV